MGRLFKGRWDICSGFPNVDPDGEPAAFAQWLHGMSLDDHSTTQYRLTVKQDQQTDMRASRTVQGVAQLTELRLNDKPQRPFVVARLTGDLSKADSLYKIGGTYTQGFDNAFYIVVSNVDLPKPDTSISLPVAKWELYGIKAGQAVKIGRHGVLRYCGVAHPEYIRNLGAQFRSCISLKKEGTVAMQTNLGAALKGRDLVVSMNSYPSSMASSQLRTMTLDNVAAWAKSIGLHQNDTSKSPLTRDQLQKLKDVRDDSSTDPVWIPCGVGCCTVAED